jgi:hypothetical protein
MDGQCLFTSDATYANVSMPVEIFLPEVGPTTEDFDCNDRLVSKRRVRSRIST